MLMIIFIIQSYKIREARRPITIAVDCRLGSWYVRKAKRLRFPGPSRGLASQDGYCLSWPLEIPSDYSPLTIQGRNNRPVLWCACTEGRNYPSRRRIGDAFTVVSYAITKHATCLVNRLDRRAKSRWRSLVAEESDVIFRNRTFVEDSS